MSNAKIDDKRLLVKKFILSLIVIALVAIGLALFWVDRRASSYITATLSKELGVTVTLEGASLSWNRLTLQGLTIPDLRGGKNALYTKTIDILWRPSTLFDATLEVPQIAIISPTIYVRLYNSSGSENNWKELLASSVTEKSTFSKDILVDELIIDNMVVQLENAPYGPSSITLPATPHIVITNLNTGNPLELDEELSVILRAIMEALSQYDPLAHILDGAPAIVGVPASVLSGLAKQIDTQGIKEAAQTLGEEIGDSIDKAKDFFSSLFK